MISKSTGFPVSHLWWDFFDLPWNVNTLPLNPSQHSWSLCSLLKAKQKTKLGLRVGLHRKVLADPSACTCGLWFTILSFWKEACVRWRLLKGLSPGRHPAPWRPGIPALWLLPSPLLGKSQASICSCCRLSMSRDRSTVAWKETWLICLALVKCGSVFVSATVFLLKSHLSCLNGSCRLSVPKCIPGDKRRVEVRCVDLNFRGELVCVILSSYSVQVSLIPNGQS